MCPDKSETIAEEVYCLMIKASDNAGAQTWTVEIKYVGISFRIIAVYNIGLYSQF